MDSQGFPGGSVVKNPLATQETLVQSLCQEYPLEKEMALHSMQNSMCSTQKNMCT